MLTNYLKKYWKYLLTSIVGIFIGLMINVPSCSKVEPKIIEIPVHDTVTVDSIQIQEKIKWKYRTEFDTLVYYLHDTDTVAIPVMIPIDHYTYEDKIATDSTSTDIYITYEGYKAKIDSIHLIHNYNHTIEIIPEQKKRVSPFIGVTMGPVINTNFKQAKGVATELNGGVIFRNGWGIQANYEMDILSNELQHSIKAGIIKQF